MVLRMNNAEFPEKATNDNAANLIERGSKILEDYFKSPYRKFLFTTGALDFFLRYTLSLCIVGLLINLLLFVMGEFAKIPITEVPRNIQYASLIYMILASFLAFYLGFTRGRRLFNYVKYRYFKFPKPENEVFSAFSSLAKNLLEGNRRKAVKTLPRLSEAIGNYTEVNNDLKRYLSHELSIFRETTTLGRLILYSGKTDIELALCFLNLGLSFINNKFSILYSKVEGLRRDSQDLRIERASKHGKIISFLGMTEHLKNLLLIILVIISIVVWLVYGIKLPFPSI